MNKQYHQTKEDLEKEMEVIRLAQQDPSKFEVLYEAYYERILGFVYQRVDSKESAYDITQQVFIAALSNIKKYKFKGVPFSAWLFRIAINELNQAFRKNKAIRTINIEEGVVDVVYEEGDASQKEENYHRLAKAMDKLKKHQLEIVGMRFFEKMSFAEIGQILNVTEGAARIKVHRVIEKLRKHI